MRALLPAALLFSLAAVACDGEAIDDGALAARGGADGNLSLEWSITAGGELLSCVDAGADGVEVILSSDAEERTESMSCFGGLAETAYLPAGTFAATAVLVDADGGELARVELGELSVTRGTTPIGLVQFEL